MPSSISNATSSARQASTLIMPRVCVPSWRSANPNSPAAGISLPGARVDLAQARSLAYKRFSKGGKTAMKPAPFIRHVPRTVAEAVRILGDVAPQDGRVLAGGQSLVPIMAFRLAKPAHLVDINEIAELGKIA